MSVPRLPLLATLSLGAIAILVASGARLVGIQPVQVRHSVVSESADLRFADMSDGSVEVSDPRDGHVVDVLPPRTNAFLRTVMRGFAQARLRAGIGGEVPFRIERTVDAHLSLSDPQTGRRVQLDPFGNLNANTFGRLLSGGARRT